MQSELFPTQERTPPPFKNELELIPYETNALKYLAQKIIRLHRSELPDLSHVVVLLSNPQAAATFRYYLLQASKPQCNALLGLQINTLDQWVSQQELSDVHIAPLQSRELMLVQALKQHPDLYGHGSPWALAQNLLELFDDFSHSLVPIPAQLKNFQIELESAYGVSGNSLPLNQEARLVHTLWYAMQQQLQAVGLTDPVNAYVMKLKRRLDQLCHRSDRQQLYLLGQTRLSLAESQWINSLMIKGKLYYGIQADAAKSTGRSPLNAHIIPLHSKLQIPMLPAKSKQQGQYERLLQRVYRHDNIPLQQRAQQFTQQQPQSPLEPVLRVYKAASSEQEAQAVEFQVRRWLLQGKQRIGIVTENRRLARRVRALLERADIHLNDAAGWILSTTSAATVVERWLQCIETDFHYQPLLDFLKSPFVKPEVDTDEFLHTVYRFEKNIVFEENISNNIERYVNHSRYRMNRLNPELAAYYANIEPLLKKIEHAAEPLQQLQQQSHSPKQLIQALMTSLDRLGVKQGLSRDDAGRKILETLQPAAAAATHSNLTMNWVEFRAWLGQLLERAYFLPPGSTGPVHLMSLAQSDLRRFDALIIASAEKEFLPGNPPTSPFFNQSVRAGLGLNSTQELNHTQFHWFYRLLHSVSRCADNKPSILISKRSHENDEEIIGSPWVEALEAFHRLSYGQVPTDPYLETVVAQNRHQIHDSTLPLPQAQGPARSPVDPGLIPKKISAGAYQELMNCPYQFFAARCLKLSPPESIRDMLQKSDYGERVHKCLQAFHGGITGLPGPFSQGITHANREAATELLQQISLQVFAQDIEENFVHRSWLKQWQAMIDQYIEWQIEHQMDWQVYQVEQAVTRQENPLFETHGRLDRIDTGKEGMNIIDYKSGKAPKQAEILSGERIQLPFYALLGQSLTTDQAVAKVQYLSFDANKISSSELGGEELSQLTSLVSDRLQDIIQAMHNGTPLPAWGDSKTCRYCAMEGLCRKQSWLDE
ncbi:MAG: PD-(D/E)XK nuclease family protein [Gammaproteobacteria bacterium]|nr:PD-(D/E)XK nuclease family protein [Gammaproteobacteria bacterium]MDH5801394.1 PD-(D/E)XK nuclease family protein [Gammaproteobacteria bacterium]